MINSRIILFSFLLTILSSHAEKPNVVIILTDDQGWGDLSLHGNHNLSTPHIDRLAKAGAQFDKFYVCPVCSPTRAEFLTGRYYHRGGVYSTSQGGERLDLDEYTIADAFKAEGYVTGAFGKWHNGMQYPYHPNGRGFDEFYGFCSGHWANYYSPMLEHNGKIVKGEGFVVDDFTDKAMLFIEKNVKAKKPFFAYLPYNTPHSPMQVPDEYWERHVANKLNQTHPKALPKRHQHTRAALAMCENIDWNVGRLIKKLDELKISDNTIVVYFHDNGPNGWRWNGGMRGKKGSTDEGGVRSPLFVKWPRKIKAETSISEVSAGIDLLPTLLELADLKAKPKKTLDGKSLKQLLLGQPADFSNRLHISSWNGKVSGRTKKFRMDDGGKLYDMSSDLGQTRDVSKKFPKEAARLKSAIDDYRLQYVPAKNKKKHTKDERSFLIGHPDFKYNQIPARDAVSKGGIKRSNKAPNCTHFINWRNVDDKIIWEVEVVEAGEFEVDLYYTCPKADVGSTVKLSFNDVAIETKITEAFDPPYIASLNDRYKRVSGDDKEWKPVSMGTIKLPKGKGILTLQATDIPGSSVMDFRLLMLKRK